MRMRRMIVLMDPMTVVVVEDVTWISRAWICGKGVGGWGGWGGGGGLRQQGEWA